MSMFRNLLKSVALLVLFVSPLIAEEIHGTMPGGEPSIKFEDGGLDFFTMFNSLLDDKVTLYGETADNPQGDTCLDSSSFTLNDKHVPNDAIVEKAYLVWMGAVDPSKLDEPTDNEVTLSFDNGLDGDASDPNSKHVVLSTSVKAGDTGKLLTDTPSFDFEGIRFQDDVEVGCSETSDGSTIQAEIGYFTYRVDVTDFMKQVQEESIKKGVTEGEDKKEGDALYGKYTVGDLDCTDHDYYKCRTTMVSAWSLILVYRSGQIRAKKLYFYNGLSYVQGARSKAEVSGFVLPSNPIVRQTLMVAEGDPALEINPAMPKEGVLLKGEDATAPYNLYNKCNPKNGLDYEVYNSNSSIINWNPDAPEDELITCVTGGVGDQKYGIDVDTFLLDSEKNINLKEHLARGNTTMDITLSVNQDAIITNFLVLSVDTKSPGWDVPPEAKIYPFPDDREKQWCACKNVSGKDTEYFCFGERPFYYMIKVENWGTNKAEDVWVSDELKDMDYIPGSTEMATHYNAQKKYYDDWTPIADKAGASDNEKFPLSGKGIKVADSMDVCDINTWTCKDSRLIRFLVKPKSGLPKQAVLGNIAVISDKSGVKYKTNNSWPIPLGGTDCVGLETCSVPSKEKCGGIKDDRCKSNDDCDPGLTCNADGNCVMGDDVCQGSIVKFAAGQNTPSSDSKHIVYKDNGNKFLTVGQLTLTNDTCSKNKNFFFKALFVKFSKTDEQIEFPEQQLVYDANANGKYDVGTDKIVVPPSSSIKESTGFRMLLDKDKMAYSGEAVHHFLIMTKINYRGDAVGRKSEFHCTIEGSSNFSGEDRGGDVTFEGSAISFATFMLEPEGNYFLVSLGEHDAAVPQTADEWKGDEKYNEIPVMQLWTKFNNDHGATNELKSLRVKLAAGSSVIPGEDITSMSLYLDMDGDGNGDILVSHLSDFTSGMWFQQFVSPVKYNANDVKYVVLTAHFKDMGEGKRASFLISDRSITLTTQTTTIGLPVKSKEFSCKGDTCPKASGGGGGGCSPLVVDSAKKGWFGLAFLLFALSSLFFVRRRLR